MTRREFLSYSAMAGVVGAIGVSPILSACAGGKKKKAAAGAAREPPRIFWLLPTA